MDPAGQGALIGIGFMICISVTCYIKDKYEKRKNHEHKPLIEVKTIPSSPTPPTPVLLKRQQSSMRDFFSKNIQPSPLKVVRIS